MQYSFAHWTPGAVLQELDETRARNTRGTAHELALIAEVDERKIYADEAYPDITTFCVGRLNMTPDSAARRVHAARAARRFPKLFEAVAANRLHLTAVTLLAPHVSVQSVDELIAAATRKSKEQIQELLAERARRLAIPVGPEAEDLRDAESLPALTLGPGEENRSLAPAQVGITNEAAPTQLLAPGPVPVHFKIEADDQALLREAKDFLPTLDVGALYRRALGEMVTRMKRGKFGVGHGRCRGVKGSRAVRPDIREEVYLRDGGCCTFKSESGHICGSRKFLEFDHVVPVAMSGQSTAANLRLLCRTHNQLEAVRRFGKARIEHKVEEGRRLRAERRIAAAKAAETVAASTAAASALIATRSASPDHRADGEGGLVNTFKLRKSDARQIAEEVCAARPGASLKEVMKTAIQRLKPSHVVPILPPSQAERVPALV